MTATSLSFFRFDSAGARLWAFAMMGGARPGLSRLPGIGFWKLCGSGTGQGFTPRPNFGVYAILATWQDIAHARAAVAEAAIYARYRRRAVESWSVFLTPLSSRGRWSGRPRFVPGHAPSAVAAPKPRKSVASAPRLQPAPSGGWPAPAAAPIAVLTRATLKLRHAPAFWRREPAISAAIGADPNVLFKIGIGELPLVHQVTFSIWPDAASMAAFARAGGPHAKAVAAVRHGGWFAEELYARFAVAGTAGAWGGACPLADRGVTRLSA